MKKVKFCEDKNIQMLLKILLIVDTNWKTDTVSCN